MNDMEESKARKAIEILKGIEEIKGNLPEDGNDVEEAFLVAIEALERQNAKAVREICGAFGETVECPECGTGLRDPDVFAGYCKWCGQRIKREELQWQK